MKAKELMEKLKDVNPEADILIRFVDVDYFGSSEIREIDLDERDIFVGNKRVIIDIAND